MMLHEFMSDRRPEILEACELELNGDDSASLAPYLKDFFDEMLRAIKRDFGIRESSSPLPGTSETAARFGIDRQRDGVPVTRLPALYAALSQAIGKTGQRYELTITAEEYQHLNRCLDVGVATSVENFWQREKGREQERITESYGFLLHELRNALGNSSLAFKLLRSGELGMKGNTAEVLSRNLTRMESLVAQAMGMVQLEVGALPAFRPVHVATLLRGIEAAAIADRGIVVVLELDEQLYIMGDETLLTSAISNLVHNAIKFSRPNSCIRLGARTSGDSIEIDVADECGGLDEKNLEELFAPYVKKREGSRTGTGLGLALSKRAVEAMQGQLSVVDRPGEGCVFIARFPRQER